MFQFIIIPKKNQENVLLTEKIKKKGTECAVPFLIVLFTLYQLIEIAVKEVL